MATRTAPSSLVTGAKVTTLLLVAVFCLAPLVLLASGSLMSSQELYGGRRFLPGTPQFDNYRVVWSEGRFYRYFTNSVLYAALIVPSSVLIASMAAFAFSRLRFRGRRVLFACFLGVLMFPLAVMFVPVYHTLVQLGLVNTRTGYVLPILAASLPLNTFIMHRFFQKIPAEIEQAAIVDGVSVWGLFYRIALPLVRPGIGAAAILTLVTVWNEFLFAVVVLRDADLMPVQQGLMQFASAERPEQQLMLAASTIAITPVVVAYLLAQRAITAGVMEGAVRG